MLLMLQGFITAHESGKNAGALSIAQMPVQVRLDTPWPLQKVALRATPHQLAFLPEHRIYALLISRPVCTFMPPQCVLTSLAKQ